MIVVFLCLLTFLIYILFAPIVIDIDSINRTAQVRFHVLLGILISYIDDKWRLQWMLVGFKGDLKGRRKKDQKPGRSRKPKEKFRLGNLNKIINVLRSFKVKKWVMDFDTGLPQLNGILYPVAYTLSGTNKIIHINFIGRNIIIIRIENNLARMLRAYLINR